MYYRILLFKHLKQLCQVVGNIWASISKLPLLYMQSSTALYKHSSKDRNTGLAALHTAKVITKAINSSRKALNNYHEVRLQTLYP